MILSEILESPCVEIIDTTGYMNNLYLRDFLYGFNPFDLSNLSHCILTTLRYQYQLLCSVQRGVDELSVPLIKLSFPSFNIFGILSCQIAAYLDYFKPYIYQMIQISGEKTVHIIRQFMIEAMFPSEPSRKLDNFVPLYTCHVLVQSLHSFYI